MTALQLRAARVHDLAAMLAVERCCMGGGAWGEQALAGELAGMPGTRHEVLAVHPSGPLAGYAVLFVAGATAYVLRVAVAPAHRRGGVGRALAEALLAEAVRRGCDEVLLEVAATNPIATALYRAARFVAVARRPHYYADGADAVVMRATCDRSWQPASVGGRQDLTMRSGQPSRPGRAHRCRLRVRSPSPAPCRQKPSRLSGCAT